jgi:hypothetical protein
MSTKRQIIDRRKSHVTEEALTFFAECEKRPRRDENFTDRSRELARMLDLNGEWWAACTPLNRSKEPTASPGYYAHDAWHRCRAIRNEMLAMLKERKRQAVERLKPTAPARTTGPS